MIACFKFPVRRWSAFHIALAALALLARPALGAETITNCLDILQLSRAEANENKPVRLRGVVTCYVPSSQLCFMQDDTSGIYVFPNIWPRDVAFGDVVEVQGMSGTGRFSPIIHNATLQSTGQRGKVRAKQVAVEDLNTGRFDSQWVEVRGVVQSVECANSICSFQLWNGCTVLKVLGFGFDPAPTNLVDATVRIEGVGGTFYDENRLAGFGLFTQNPQLIQVVVPAPAPFDAPLRPARNLAYYSKDGGLDHRVRVKGVVSVAWPGEALFVQDESGSLLVRPRRPADEQIKPGDIVEAAGFIRDVTETPHLAQASVRKNGVKNPPDPIFLKPKELSVLPPIGQYVTTSGVLFSSRSSETDYALLDLQFENRMVTAVCHREGLADLVPGSLVRVTGAWSSAPAKLHEQLGPVIWLHSPAAMMVLAPPNNGPVSSNARNVTIASCAAAALLFIGVFGLLERQKAHRLSVAQNSIGEKLADTEREIQRLSEERERLGRDLHDRIIQSIYGIGLNLDHCAQMAQADPGKVQTRLQAALKDMNGVIGELRNVILGLEANVIQPREFRTALKSLSLALGHEESKNRIRLVMDEDAVNALTPSQATELIHIAREAMSNSIRHGGALMTTFRLEPQDEIIRFIIEDDGCGFDLNTPHGNGFGLRNMAKRAESLGAKFSIFSEEGQGTRVTLDIPRQKQHFSTHEPRTSIDR